MSINKCYEWEIHINSIIKHLWVDNVSATDLWWVSRVILEVENNVQKWIDDIIDIFSNSKEKDDIKFLLLLEWEELLNSEAFAQRLNGYIVFLRFLIGDFVRLEENNVEGIKEYIRILKNDVIYFFVIYWLFLSKIVELDNELLEKIVLRFIDSLWFCKDVFLVFNPSSGILIDILLTEIKNEFLWSKDKNIRELSDLANYYILNTED